MLGLAKLNFASYFTARPFAIQYTPALNPYYQDKLVTIYHGDCAELLPAMPDVDLIVADVPYSFGLNSTDDGASWGDLMNAAQVYAGWLRQFRRLTATKNGAAWVFNSWRSFPVLARGANDARWPITSLMVWDKGRMGAGPLRGLRPRYELCALLMHDGFKIQNRKLTDIWLQPLPYRKPTGHKSEKPVGLIEKIICESGSRSVLDPFLGSGTTAVAAKQLGVKCIGIEIEERWCEVAAKRAEQAEHQSG
ncbi:MAG TPA: site-specific DNA-methyltransferase [Blastocatellia bacterium]|nr:site-specific DNA-methyltransferase [Blastocatellia bacterium]HMV81780.1 site-specific DNA-methyltransferase [Blastocatellia bacterium]HMX24741.1 site-specific DNA-methyltransferase [Blastocatellia bacterium]HMY70678.1 site-specific DNA-methyltransferase [Blastocatellia bacterium]HMZ16468.1 site-specific DNA-methyltransferase [Blastocatellia bacterium]